MNRIRISLLFAIIITILSLLGCDNSQEQAKSKPDATAGDVKKEAAQTLTKAQNYTQQQRDKYQKMLDEKLKYYDQKLDEMKSDAKSKTESMKEDAKIQYEKTIASLSEKKREAAVYLDKLRQESGDAWSDTKTKLDEVMDELKKAFDQNETKS